MKQRYSFGYFLSEGFHSIFTHGLMSFAAVCMIICCLIIMGSFSLVAVNLNNMLGDLERENEFLAYVDETYTDEQARALEKAILQVPNVDSALFVSREEAMEKFVEDKKEVPLLNSLPADVLRDRYRIHVVDIERMSETVEGVHAVTGISDMSVDLGIAKGFVVVRNIAGGVAAVLVATLLLVSLFIITNTIKLATFNRREEIAIMKMCGATNGFIRWPFIFEGMILGIFGAIMAFLLQWGIYTLIGRAIGSSDTISLITVLPFEDIYLRVLGVFAGTGLVIGVGGSIMAIRRFLQV